jgi:hypothetical protein
MAEKAPRAAPPTAAPGFDDRGWGGGLSNLAGLAARTGEFWTRRAVARLSGTCEIMVSFRTKSPACSGRGGS